MTKHRCYFPPEMLFLSFCQGLRHTNNHYYVSIVTVEIFSRQSKGLESRLQLTSWLLQVFLYSYGAALEDCPHPRTSLSPLLVLLALEGYPCAASHAPTSFGSTSVL